MAINKKDAEKILTQAMKHLESHWPDRVGMNAQKPFWRNDSFTDYAAWQILKAARDLVQYTQ